jgi:hypothetical protein
MSIDEVAVLAGISPGYVYHIEHYPAQVSVEAIQRLALALDTTVAALLGGDEPQHASRG